MGGERGRGEPRGGGHRSRRVRSVIKNGSNDGDEGRTSWTKTFDRSHVESTSREGLVRPHVTLGHQAGINRRQDTHTGMLLTTAYDDVPIFQPPPYNTPCLLSQLGEAPPISVETFEKHSKWKKSPKVIGWRIQYEQLFQVTRGYCGPLQHRPLLFLK